MNDMKFGQDLKNNQSSEAEIFGIEKLTLYAHQLSQELIIESKISKNKIKTSLKDCSEELLTSYLFLSNDTSDHSQTPATEWYLDNFHIVEDQINLIKRDLPDNFYQELPKIKKGEFMNQARVYALAFLYLKHTDSKLNLEEIKEYIKAFQTHSPLLIGEIWAFAITIRISLLKILLTIVKRIIISRQKRLEADELADLILETSLKPFCSSENLVELLSFNLRLKGTLNRPFLVKLIQRLRDQDLNIAKVLEWLENILISCESGTEEIVKLEHYQQAKDQMSIGNIINSMRLLSTIDWHDFFEEVNLIDPILAKDPAHCYLDMDRTTKDTYRKAIERVARRSQYTEIQIAQKAIKCSEYYSNEIRNLEKKNHVGYYLIDQGVLELEEDLDYQSPISEKVTRFIKEDPLFIYFGSLFVVFIFLISIIFYLFPQFNNQWSSILWLTLLFVIPLSDVSISLINYIITIIQKPHPLPRMETKGPLPQSEKTMVVIPCLLNDKETIKDLINSLEVHYLSNQDPSIYFSLLGDFIDSDKEIDLEDQTLLDLAKLEIEKLNVKYNKKNDHLFYFFCRKRMFNPSEKKWMGWERKRGKIIEFNQLILQNRNTSFLKDHIHYHFLKNIKNVITLDADTQLPLGTAKKLIATIFHPLNKPVYCEKENRIIDGYAILQPRISISNRSAFKTRFSYIFAGNTGIDPYTTAISDIYQDFFNEGSFTGKGLYVVDAFMKVLDDRVPENTVLSHDLLEGSYARVGLMTDIELIDDYPRSFKSFEQRLHRWTRGDWQILPWLFPYVLDAKNKWKKNHLPFISKWKIIDNLRRSLIAPMVLLWIILSWSILPGNVFLWSFIIFISLSFPIYAPSLKDLSQNIQTTWIEHFLVCYKETKKRAEQIFFMFIFLPSIALNQIDAIIKTLFRMFISKKKLLEWVSFSQTQQVKTSSISWKIFISTGPLFSLILFLIILITHPFNLVIALPFLICWFVAPLINFWTQMPIKSTKESLHLNEIEEFHCYARLNWHYFEAFTNKENHWLIPDNFQEDPEAVLARRTSPTNIGLQLLSILSAYDFQYITRKELLTYFENIFSTLYKLEKSNGHFYNWYDTQYLTPLEPKYISTVDSGNFAGHLIVIKQACIEISQTQQSDKKINIRDNFLVLKNELKKLTIHKNQINIILDLFKDINELENHELLKKLANIDRLFHQTLDNFLTLTQNSILYWIHLTKERLENLLKTDSINDLEEMPRFLRIADQCDEIASKMDFTFLYNKERKLFSIGHNVSQGLNDDSYYDLFASESRLTSLWAIAKGDIHEEHWFHLGRKLTKIDNGQALLSWSASIFEYLMPLLVMKSFKETLLNETYQSIVRRQIEYGFQRKTPWGISESGYHSRDQNFHYQYGPFGIPGLGLKRGLSEDLVISPYSSMLAAMIDPQTSLKNLNVLTSLGSLGTYGFYEALDYTKKRNPKDKTFTILKSFMAHHQGMSLVSINNVLHDFIMQKRFHIEPRIKSVELLLQERIPRFAVMTQPRKEETKVDHFKKFNINQAIRVYHDPSLSTPRTQILSNGNYSVMMTSAGAGYSKCEDYLVSRWREDSTTDQWGQFIYIKDLNTQKVWSAGFKPTLVSSKKYEVHFSEDKIEISRVHHDLHSHLQIIISSEDNVEMRRLILKNQSLKTMEMSVTSYLEIALQKPLDEQSHPAFNNLFIETSYQEKNHALIAHRRIRSPQDKSIWSFHQCIVEGGDHSPLTYETDRSRFLGRGRDAEDPIVMTNDIDLSLMTGSVLDPIFSLSKRLKINPQQMVTLTFTTGLTFSENENNRLIEKYHDVNIFLRQSNLGWIKNQIALQHLNMSAEKAHLYQRLGGRILYLAPFLRAQSEILSSNTKTQSTLWSYGISGDYPILLSRIHDQKDIEMIKELLHCQEYLRLKGLKFDLVILNDYPTSYFQNLHDELLRQIHMSGFHSFLDKPAGIFIRKSDLIPKEDLVLFKSISRICLFANKGTLQEQLERRPFEVPMPLPLIAKLERRDYPRELCIKEDLQFNNGFGGFNKNGSEYIVTLKEDQWTPAPWINVIANQKDFGFIISDSGLGNTWSINSRENRLTPWSNDPISSPSSEVIYLRDEETGVFWTPTPLPIRGKDPYTIKHGIGYSEFFHQSHGLSQHILVFTPLNESVKIIRLKLKNINSLPRKISIFSYIQWVLSSSHNQSLTIVCAWNELTQTMMIKNTYHDEFSQRMAFHAHSEQTHSYTSDRKEFIGRNLSQKKPAALLRTHLSNKVGSGFDSCSAIQSIIELKPHEEKEIIILMGQEENQQQSLALSILYKDIKNVNHAFAELTNFWNKTLKTITIETPDPSFNIMTNYWLIYQTLSCRIWARSAFYQSGGAFGFRDQLQDVMGLVFSNPKIARDQILLCASRQFIEGDVQHWWHPPSGRGVRTNFSDDLLWLPFVLNYYLSITHDLSILDVVVPFIEAPKLNPLQDESYTEPLISSESATLYEHCLLILHKSLKLGSHDLPLMGSGDWNDGFNRIGHLGKGESVWLAWFLYKTMKDFIPYCQIKKDHKSALKFEHHLKKLGLGLNKNSWDGQWYLRAYDDDGKKIGSNENLECKIDSIAQSWAVLSDVGEPEKIKLAMMSLEKNLINTKENLILLFSPPFNKGDSDPGYIKGYLPGIRENGGQYTHAAIWTIMAFAKLGDHEKAYQLFSMINPINHSKTLTGAQKYKVEPYVMSADVYGIAPHLGRGGWSWYTGSSSWMYRCALESILGFHLHSNKVILKPCIPHSWPQFKISYLYKKTSYQILVLNNQNEESIEVDGIKSMGNEFILSESNKEVQVIVKILSH